MKSVESPFFVALPASAAAGPIFQLTFLGALAFSILPKPIPIGPGVLISIGMALIPSALVGFFISYLPNVICAYVLAIGGEINEIWRRPLVWIGVGAFLGLLLAMLFGAFSSMPTASALVATSAASAGLCRKWTRWEDPNAQA